jgi:hypothetical protein
MAAAARQQNNRLRTGQRRQMLEHERMSEAHSRNAVSQIPLWLYCGLRPFCPDHHDCRCMRREPRLYPRKTRTGREKRPKSEELSA